MRPEDFDLFSTIVKQRSGLVLTPEKAYLLESRLMPVARKWNLKNLDDLAASIRAKREEALLRDMTEAMTTNESSFFRDQRPFDQFRQVVLPKLLETRAGKKHIRIWSAASSSGQEAYTLAMLLNEDKARLAGWRIEIVGTDLSSEMVERARSGIYTQFEVQRGLPITLLVKYFTQQGDKWQINQDIRNMVSFREMNLLQDFGPIGVFDVVFCRNVLIYFDAQTKGKVLESISRVMTPDGVLYLGGAETVLGITDKFKPLEGQRALYVQSSASAGLYGAPAGAAPAQPATGTVAR
ncbi:MAG: methyltransferase domain-containing protein [Alphaproteobacteria bacterium]|nr:methyltransferase domain-containing protein [Alphaproteobacteria bacterium]